MHNGLRFTSKLSEVKTTIFTVMSQLANQYNAINLSQGFPDFNCSEELISLVNEYMKKGFNQYAHMAGAIELRVAIANKTKKLYQSTYNPDSEITITSGATEAIFAAITTVVQSGDEVLIFDPSYDSYAPSVQLNGGVPISINLAYPNYSIDWEKVHSHLSPKTKLIIVNTPHNPTGSILGREDIEQLEQIVERYGLYVLSDEVYEHIIFDQHKHLSLVESSILKARTFVINSFGKTFHTTGWKVGYCLAPQELTTEFRKIHQYLTFSTCSPMQYALADFLVDETNWRDLGTFYQQKRDLLISLLHGSRWEALPNSGTYFQLLSYKNFSNEKDTELARRITKEHGLASIPISVFYKDNTDNKVLRFCFAKENSTLKQAAEILCKI